MVLAATASDARRWALLTIVLGTTLCLAVIIQARNGVSMSPDSVNYYSTATNLLDGNGLRDYTLGRSTTFPPGMALALAPLLAITRSATGAAVLLNCVCAIVFSQAAVALMRALSFSLRAGLAASLLLALSPAMHEVNGWLWSEPPFLAASMLFTYLFIRAVDAPAGRIDLLVMTVAAALATVMLRYTGIVLVVSLGSASLVFLRATPQFRRCIAVSSISMAASASALAGWFVLNSASGAAPAGERPSAVNTISMNVLAALSKLHRWVLPGTDDLLFLAPLSLGISILAVYVALKERVDPLVGRWCRVLLAVSLVYAASVIVLATLTAVDWIDNRLMAPALPFLVLGMTPLLTPWASRHHRLVAALLGGWTVLALISSVGLVNATSHPRGVTAPAYMSSPALLTARRALAGSTAPVLTNEPYALYLVTGHQPTLEAERATAYGSDTPVDDTSRIQQAADGGEILLVWLEIARPSWYLTPESQSFPARVVLRRPDGRIYRLDTRRVR